MARPKSSIQGFERGAAADLWRHTLSQIPQIFGRLAYLSSLRNPNTGKYEHHGLTQLYGAERAHRTLAESHDGAFADWLNYDLAQQQTDLAMYLSTLDGDLKTVLGTWQRLETYKQMIPATASDSQRELFVLDLEAILDGLRASAGESSPGPIALPRP
jgi:hypothetical protein